MGCSSCGGHAPITVAPMVSKTTTSTPPKPVVVKKAADYGKVVEKSEDPSKKVRLRYFGGEARKGTGTGCSTCGGSKNSYVKTTSETITFVSEDEPNKLFRRLVSIGQDIYVTRKQADYLLTLSYQNRGGELVHKFKEIE